MLTGGGVVHDVMPRYRTRLDKFVVVVCLVRFGRVTEQLPYLTTRPSNRRPNKKSDHFCPH